MKKRTLLVVMALVLVFTLAIPGAALADFEASQMVTLGSFTGTGTIFIANEPDLKMRKSTWKTKSEIVQGRMDSEWELLNGAWFDSVHDSVLRLDESGNFSGVMNGRFSISKPDGVMEGVFNGKMSGTMIRGPNDEYLLVDLVDTGTWVGNKGTGVFSNIVANGTWSANLGPGFVPGTEIPTLIGPFTWEGKYIERMN